MLHLENISAGYAGLEVLHNVSLEVAGGEIVALLGANGAGKTTTLRTISGLLQPTVGRVLFEGRSLAGRAPHEVVRRGIAQAPEERSLFGGLTVAENLLMGGYTRSTAERAETLQEVHALFPVLAERRGQVVSTLSGGQQQMVAIGRALMTRPRLLLLDEPSLGLDPRTTAAVFGAVQRIRDLGIAVLLVEQNAAQALRIANRAFVVESGEITLEGSGATLLEDARVRSAYLGL